MFWKSVNPLPIKSLSLVKKLMALYSLSTFAILAAVSSFLYPMFFHMLAQFHGGTVYYTTAQCYKDILITLLLSSLCAVFLGYWVARNGLKTIREFATKMETISAESLHERINQKEWPKELKRLGDSFNSMLDGLENSFTQLSQFSSDIAHELRTPLHNLRGMTEIELAKSELPQEYRQLLESQMNEYHYLTKLVESLLFLARAEQNHFHIKKKIINIRHEILNICEYYQVIADEKEIKLICEGEASIAVDDMLFKRVISNLLSNALKYTSNKGQIRIAIENLNDHLVQISIHDTGIGIAEHHLSKIFDRFYRIDSSRSAQSGGVGLGLAIVKSIIQLHKGKISIESKINYGTSIYLELPSH